MTRKSSATGRLAWLSTSELWAPVGPQVEAYAEGEPWISPILIAVIRAWARFAAPSFS